MNSFYILKKNHKIKKGGGDDEDLSIHYSPIINRVLFSFNGLVNSEGPSHLHEICPLW
jgi:hypothetical protein